MKGKKDRKEALLFWVRKLGGKTGGFKMLGVREKNSPFGHGHLPRVMETAGGVKLV